MSDQYLWDGSGVPDREIAKLERTLAPLGHRAGPLALPRRAPSMSAMFRRYAVGGLSVAATIALVTWSAWVGVATRRAAGWQVSSVGGVPRVNDRAIGASASWRPGDRLHTDGTASARVEVGEVGSVEVGPNSLVTLERARRSEHRISIERGHIRAQIWAPPGVFFVDTPSAEAIDLGCAYTLDVGPDGSGLLRVEHGWVGFRDEGRESFIPEGAVCATRRGRGPGTPYYSDAPPALAAALSIVDFGEPAGRAAAVASALSAARPRDALSIWHLLVRTFGAERAAAFERLSQLAPPPASVTRDGVMSGNRAMLDAWWDVLGMESASWWRMWETPWPR